MLISTDPTIVSPCVGKIHWELELLPEVNTFLNSIKINSVLTVNGYFLII